MVIVEDRGIASLLSQWASMGTRGVPDPLSLEASSGLAPSIHFLAPSCAARMYVSALHMLPEGLALGTHPPASR